MKLKLSASELILVKRILTSHLPPHTKVWVFGSRLTNKVKPFSDLDLLIDAGNELPPKTLIDLADEFDESDLPYKVDLLDWHSIDESFRKLITQNTFLIMG